MADMDDDQERWGPPIPPEPEDGDFEKMAQLFIDTYDLLVASINSPYPGKDFMRERDKRTNKLLVSYTEIMKHRNEQLFAQLVQEGIEE